MRHLFRISVCYTEISGPNNSLEELVRHLQNPEQSVGKRVPVVELVGQDELRNRGGVNDLYIEIHVLSIGKDEEGRMALKVAGREQASIHTLVLDGRAWRKR